MKTFLSLTIVAVLVSGCATRGTDGFVEIGPNMYMGGGLGGMMDYSGSGVKARYFQQAREFCSERGLAMVPINSTGTDSGIGTFASAEVQFKCAKAD